MFERGKATCVRPTEAAIASTADEPTKKTRTDTETGDHDTDHAAGTIPFSDFRAVFISVGGTQPNGVAGTEPHS